MKLGQKKNWANVVTGAIFLISMLSASYDDWFIFSGKHIKYFFIVVAIAYTLWGILMVVDTQKKQFNHEKLFEEMKNANEIEHPFSIVAIKDTFEQYPNKYLLYYDTRWNCWFFFNFQTKNDERQNETSIKKGLSAKLKIDAEKFELEFKDEAIHHKYSESDKRNKYYHHSLYNCVIKEFSDELKQESFTIDGVKYAWMTIDEMEKNTSIKKKNSEVVEFVKHNN